MSTYLSEDVVEKILSSLPSKSLIRFRCISKAYLALIGNPDLLSKKLLNNSILTTKSEDPSPSLLVAEVADKSNPTKQIYSFLSYDTLNCESRTHHDHDLDIVASCHGLVCFYEYYGENDLYLWNPAMSSSGLKALPPLPRPYSTRHVDSFAVGFGFDPRSNDFKVVRVFNESYSQYVVLYSLNSGSWREIKADVNMLRRFHPTSRTTTYVNEMFFWWMSEKNDNRIVGFDFSDEVFSTTPLPDANVVGNYDLWWSALNVLNGSIAMTLFHCTKEKKMYYDIWVLLELGVKESWTKLFTIKPSSHLGRPLGFWKNGELFMENIERQLVLYDPFTHTTKNLQLDGTTETRQVVLYTQSSVTNKRKILGYERKSFLEDISFTHPASLVQQMCEDFNCFGLHNPVASW